MPNIYDVGNNNLQFQIYNLLGPIDGHITVVYNTRSKKFCFKKHGEFQNFTSYKKVKHKYRKPAQNETEFLLPIITRILKNSGYYVRNEPPYYNNMIFVSDNLVY